MKVNVEREVDIERLLINLNEKSKCTSVGMAGYEVTVNKQLLRDAHDVIKQLIEDKNNKPKYKVGDDVSLLGSDCALYKIIGIEEGDNENVKYRYYLERLSDQKQLIVVENMIEKLFW